MRTLPRNADTGARSKMLTAIGFGILILYVLELKRQIDEVGEAMSQLHKDFRSEVRMRYGGGFSGEE